MARPGLLLDAILMLRPVLRGVAVRRMAPKLVQLLAFAVLFAILASVVIFVGFFLLHHCLIGQGYTSGEALLMVLAIAFALLMGCALVMRRALSKLKRSPIPSLDLSELVDAFLEGLGGEKRRN